MIAAIFLFVQPFMIIKKRLIHHVLDLNLNTAECLTDVCGLSSTLFRLQLHAGKYQGNLETPDEINTIYSLTKELGKGAYGTVYLAENRETKKQ